MNVIKIEIPLEFWIVSYGHDSAGVYDEDCSHCHKEHSISHYPFVENFMNSLPPEGTEEYVEFNVDHGYMLKTYKSVRKVVYNSKDWQEAMPMIPDWLEPFTKYPDCKACGSMDPDHVCNL